jgi:hypothetical protein
VAAADVQMKFRLLRADIDELKGEFRDFASKVEGKFDKLYELVDGLSGEFKKFDEEQIVLSGRQSRHSDRLEKIEKKVFGRVDIS